MFSSKSFAGSKPDFECSSGDWPGTEFGVLPELNNGSVLFTEIWIGWPD